MSELPDQNELRYLPVDIGDQRFAIPLSDVAGAHPRRIHSEEETGPPLTVGESVTEQFVIDMRKLFWGTDIPADQGYTISLTALDSTWVLIVDRLYPVATASAETHVLLPPILAMLTRLFEGAITGSQRPVLILNARNLVEMAYRTAPHLAQEAEYVH